MFGTKLECLKPIHGPNDLITLRGEEGFNNHLIHRVVVNAEHLALASVEEATAQDLDLAWTSLNLSTERRSDLGGRERPFIRSPEKVGEGKGKKIRGELSDAVKSAPTLKSTLTLQRP